VFSSFQQERSNSADFVQEPLAPPLLVSLHESARTCIRDALLNDSGAIPAFGPDCLLEFVGS
jgi:hypothetical protein